MKKMLLWLALLWLSPFVLWITHAQSFNSATTDIREIRVRYCNDPEKKDEKSLFIDAEAGKKSVICIDFINTAKKKAKIGINFVDGAVTDDSDQKKACLWEGEKSNFWQYVQNYPETLEIEPNSAKRVFVDLLFSGGYAGASYGCLTYHALDSKPTTQNMEGNMFNVFTRVGSFIDGFVSGDFKIELMTTPIISEFYHNETDNPNFIIYREWSRKEGFWKKSFWTYKAKINILNTGNVAVSGDISMKWSDYFILSKTTILEDQVFLPKQTRSFEVKLPRYVVRILWGNTKVSAEVEYQPIYLWEYAKTATMETFVLSDSTSTRFFPWILILAVFCLLKRIRDGKIVINKKTTEKISKAKQKIAILKKKFKKSK